MSAYDLIIRGGTVVTPDGVKVADLGVTEGRIARIAATIAEPAVAEIDATGRWVLPGIIDAHVHFNEPGRTEWEGIATGSAALAAGGGTCFFDMPLNSEPPVLDAARLNEKRAIAEKKSATDFALWGGLTPVNLDRLGELRDAGAIGLKAFMCESGIASFPHVDAGALREGMKRAAALGLLVAVHAEDETLAARLTAEQKAAGRNDARGYLASRPVEVELAAIGHALEFAGETGCALHVVHVSSPEGLALIADAKRRGVDATAETCPHYLILNEEDVARIGAAAKCAPPVRDDARRRGLWADLRAGRVDTVGSDHSPAPAAMKEGSDFFAIWGGIAGVQRGFGLVMDEALNESRAEKTLSLLATVLARNVARRFRLGSAAGVIAEGAEANFAIWERGTERQIEAAELQTRHKISAYVGRRCRARVTHTFLRGEAVWADGRLTPEREPARFLRPRK
ncbi:MAG TPA: allantoinase AllB [Opitutus sp.]|nr:allantoinase AllB [Opitutus sp.]